MAAGSTKPAPARYCRCREGSDHGDLILATRAARAAERRTHGLECSPSRGRAHVRARVRAHDRRDRARDRFRLQRLRAWRLHAGSGQPELHRRHAVQDRLRRRQRLPEGDHPAQGWAERHPKLLAVRLPIRLRGQRDRHLPGLAQRQQLRGDDIHLPGHRPHDRQVHRVRVFVPLHNQRGADDEEDRLLGRAVRRLGTDSASQHQQHVWPGRSWA